MKLHDDAGWEKWTQKESSTAVPWFGAAGAEHSHPPEGYAVGGGWFLLDELLKPPQHQPAADLDWPGMF